MRTGYNHLFVPKAHSSEPGWHRPGHSDKTGSHHARHLLTRAPGGGWAVFMGALGGCGVTGPEAEPGFFVEILLQG